jgi:hypothetical protein
MRRILCGTIVLLFAVARPALAGDEAEMKALLAKALKARGSDAKDKAVTMKGKGTFYGLGEGIPYVGVWQIEEPDKIRVSIEIKGDMAFQITRVVNGDKGWAKFNDDVKELEKDAIAEEKENLYVGRLTNLAVFLKEKGFKFSPVGEVKVGDRPAVGVRVSHKGHRDVTLFFDKQNHRLIKTATTVKDVEMGGQEHNQETVYSEFKEVGGVWHAMKAEIRRGGERFVEVQWEAIEPAERLDPAIFAKP